MHASFVDRSICGGSDYTVSSTGVEITWPGLKEKQERISSSFFEVSKCYHSLKKALAF